MTKKNLVTLICLILLVGCNTNSTKEKELALKEKELELKEKELNQKKITDSIAAKSTQSTVSIESSNIEKLIGYWFTPHAATVNIRFYRNKTFVLNDYNSTLDKEEKLTGTFDLTGNTLTLLYEDRAKQKFTFYKGEGDDDNYYIKNPGNYFVKGESGDGQ
jgi:hypothetical protein